MLKINKIKVFELKKGDLLKERQKQASRTYSLYPRDDNEASWVCMVDVRIHIVGVCMHTAFRWNDKGAVPTLVGNHAN